MRTAFCLVSLCLSTACALSQMQERAAPVDSLNQRTAKTRVMQLLDDAYQAHLNANPISASMRGFREYDAMVPDLSDQARTLHYQGIEARLSEAKRLLESSNELAPSDRLSLELLIAQCEDRLNLRKFHREEQRLTQLNGLQTWLMQLTKRLPITSEEHRKSYLRRLQKLDVMIGEEVALLRRGLRRGNTPPRAVLEGVEAQINGMLNKGHLAEPLTHPLLSPFQGTDIPALEKNEAIDIFNRTLVPSIRDYQTFVVHEYLPAARTTIAASDLPNGHDFYQALITHYTTTKLMPDEIHQLGLKEVKRIRLAMEDVMRKSTWAQGRTSEELTLDGFLRHLREEPSFYFATSQEMMQEYAVIAKEVDLHLAALFGHLPRLPFGLEEMDASIAERAPTAYYYSGSSRNGKPGRFIVNTSKLNERPKYEMRALALHEAEPGHHLQIALAQELASEGLHPWRETLSFTVFVEGWALYAEQLGYHMGEQPCGLYCDPYDRFGQLAYEMWRALRLVVDTGIHAKGWSRERAVDYMLANSSMSPHNAKAEVDRYVAWPGQALAYKLGELEIKRLRQRAEITLGDGFDLRDFHDEILGRGALPLDLLKRYVESWIQSHDGASNQID